MADDLSVLFDEFDIGDNVLRQALESSGRQVIALAGGAADRSASEVARDPRFKLALSASILALNALLAASSSRCRRSAPPADVEMVTDANGNLIYRCVHKSPDGPHMWKLDGTPI